MKSKKIPALITTLALILGLFAVIPVSVSAANNAANEWEAFAGNFISSETPSAGYDSRIYATTSESVITKKAYNLKETTFVFANASFPSDWTNIVFSKNRSGGLASTDAANGTLSLLVRQSGDTLSLNYWNGGGEGGFVTVPKADKYKFSIVTAGDITRLRINDTVINNDIANTFSANAGESYIFIFAAGAFKADVKLANNDSNTGEWIRYQPATGHAFGTVYGYDSEKANMNVNGSDVASTVARYNMLENTLLLTDYTFSGSWFNITFGSSRGQSLSITENTFGFIVNPGVQVWTADGKHNNGAHTAESYKIGFAKVNGEYRLYINDIYWTGDDITVFCESGNAASCYISSYSAGSFTADFSVVSNNEINDWITTNGVMNHNVDGDTTDTRRFVWSGLGVATRGTHNLLHDKFVLKNVDVAKNSGHWNSIVFSDKQFGTFTSTSADAVCLFMVPVLSGKSITAMNFAVFNNNWDWLRDETGNIAAIPAADEYVFRFVKNTDGAYALEINGKVFSKTAFNDFCNGGYAKNSYVTLSTSNSFKATPEFISPEWEIVKEKEYGAPEYDFSADGSCNAVIKRSSYIREKKQFTMNKTSLKISAFSLPDDALTPNATDNPNEYGCSMAIVFAKNPNVTESVVATSEQLTFAIRKLTDNKGISVHVVNAAGGWEYLGFVDNAEAYNLSIVYSVSMNKYMLKINNTVLNVNNVIDNFFADGAKATYILIGSHKTTVTANLKATQAEAVLGDVNADGERDILDAVLAQRELEEIDAKTDLSDTDGNGILEAEDIAAIKEIWFAGGINGFAYAQ